MGRSWDFTLTLFDVPELLQLRGTESATETGTSGSTVLGGPPPINQINRTSVRLGRLKPSHDVIVHHHDDDDDADYDIDRLARRRNNNYRTGYRYCLLQSHLRASELNPKKHF